VSSQWRNAATKPDTLAGACHEDQLTIRWIDSGKTGGGHLYATIVLSNKSTSDCWLSGPLGLIIIDPDQRPITTPINLSTSTVRVVLKPGGSAAASMTFSSDRNPPPGRTTCSPMMAVFRIVIPEGTYGLTVPGWHLPQCPADVITIGDLVAGTTAPPA
jgi:hypothetical protein